MTAAAETSQIEARVGHYYQMDGTYVVGRREKKVIALSAVAPLAARNGVDAAVLFQFGEQGGIARVIR